MSESGQPARGIAANPDLVTVDKAVAVAVVAPHGHKGEAAIFQPVDAFIFGAGARKNQRVAAIAFDGGADDVDLAVAIAGHDDLQIKPAGSQHHLDPVH